MSIAQARVAGIGIRVHVTGVVTAEPGFVGESPLFAIGDGSAGIFVRVSPVPAGLRRGRALDLVGTLAAPYGQLEIRDLTRLTQADLAVEPEASRIDLSAVGESTEGLLVNVRGTVVSTSTSSGRVMFEIADGPVVVRVYASSLTGLARADVKKDTLVAVTGVVGQRSSGKGRLDGYRVWLRSRADYVVRPDIKPEPTPAPTNPQTPGPTASETSTTSPAPTPTPGSTPHRELAAVLGTRGAAVDVEAVVTATADLIRIDGPTIVVDDGTASAAVVLPDGSAAPAMGAEIRVIGTVGRWETGPIVRATSVQSLGSSVDPEAAPLNVAPDASVEWRLVRVYGPVDKAVRAGVRWRIELLVGGQRVVVLGEPPAGALVADPLGRMATITGIVRRSTSDSAAFQVLPRGPSDLRFGPAVHSATPKPTVKQSQPPTTLPRIGPGDPSPTDAADRLIPLAELGAHRGERVMVSGVVTDAAGGEITVDDGTATVRVGGDAAADQLELLRPGDAVQIGGTVSEDDLGLLLVADPAAVIVLPGTNPLANGTAASASGGDTDGSGSARPGQSLARNPMLAGVAAATDGPGSSAALRSSAAGEPVDLATFLLVFLIAVGALGSVAVAASLTKPARARKRAKTASEGAQAEIRGT